MFRRAFTLSLLACWVCCVHSETGELQTAYEQAKASDAAYQAALAERDANQIQSRIARSAYYPELSATAARLETESAVRKTLALTQPIINVERHATFKEGEPRAILADATYAQREHELAQRVFKAVGEWIRVRASLALNEARIKAIEFQVTSATRALELGHGTVTDLRDSEVRLAQAKSGDFILKARKEAAERQFEITIGSPPGATAFRIGNRKPVVLLPALSEYLTQGLAGNPQIQIARQQARIAELGELRAKAAYIPTLSAVAQQSEINNVKSTYLGISVSLPVKVGGYLQIQGAAANTRKAEEQTREAEQRGRLEIQRLHALVSGGVAEVEMRIEAIKAAELSLIANQKSFKGGVRTTVDVLNAIQTVFQTKEDYVNSVAQLAENLLNLQLQAAVSVDLALKQVQTAIF